MYTLILSPKSWQEGTFLNQHHVYTHTGDGKIHLILKGTVAPKNLRGEHKTPWVSLRLILKIPLYNIFSKNQWFQIEQWAPQMTLNGLSYNNDTLNFGYQIRWTKLRNPPKMPINEIHIEAEIALRDGHCQIHQLNYHIDLVGMLVDQA